jgi:hypothetical protein
MGKLACTIVLYRPDPDLLAANFRFWQVEALLDEAAILIDRCLDGFKDYCALDYAWNQLEADLETQEKKLGIYRQTTDTDIFRRDIVASEEQGSLSDTIAGLSEESETAVLSESSAPEQVANEPAETPGIKSSLDLRAEALQRVRELAAPGRPFALDEQRDLALKRLCRDYEEAVNRACVAAEGLAKLYGHVGESAPLPSEAETLGTSITELSSWIRNSCEWLAGYHRREQAFTRVISVRSLMNRNAWALVKHSRESYSTKLQVPADLFRGYDNCHLRGIGAFLVGEAGTVPWSLSLRLPEEALYERSGQSVEVEQSARPSCLLGRVEGRRSLRSPEICGESSLKHASPIGRSTQGGMWTLEIIKPVGATSESFGHLEDVVLEISATGLPQKP